MAQVKVNEGILEGELVQNEYGGSFYSFKGIPYAEPPVGDLRFKAPIPKKPWNGVRDAKEFGSVCYQAGWGPNGSPPRGSEDCLYLNIYTPDLKPKTPLSVMFYIHGGAFVSGSGNDDMFGPEFLVKHDVILVAINYRLEVLGFLCLDTPDVPGNAGMKDQVQALRWINQNISSFGGDPQNITIFGESAGSCSVSYHLISPMTKGLFKRAIMQSGCNANWWAKVFKPVERAQALAKQLGFNCNAGDLSNFFKNQAVESLVKVQVPLTFSENVRAGFELSFGIVSEKKFEDGEIFFNGDIRDLLPDAIHEGVEIIAGYTADEGIIILGFGDPETMYEQADKFPIYFTPKPIAMNCSVKEQFEAGQKIKEFFIKNYKPFTWEQLADFHSFEVLVYDIINWAKICASKNTTYFYKFTCKSERNISATMFGVGKLFENKQITCHCDDVFYMFNGKMELLKKVDVASDTYKMIENTTKLWTNFAKYGNPTPDDTLGITWEPYNIEKEEYLDIGNTLVTKTKPDYEKVKFWEEIYRQHAPELLYKVSGN